MRQARDYTLQRMMNNHELPVGFLLIMSAFEFSEICSMCGDFDFDVLEVFVDGHNALFFYDILELQATVFYCLVNGFEYKKYVIQL